ncbi:MAG: hypothetical protein AAF919_08255 [Pseudomonadota bacterium]
MRGFLSRIFDVCLNGFAYGALAVAAILWLDPYGLGEKLATTEIGTAGTFLLWAALGSGFAAARLIKDLFEAIDSVA